MIDVLPNRWAYDAHHHHYGRNPMADNANLESRSAIQSGVKA